MPKNTWKTLIDLARADKIRRGLLLLQEKGEDVTVELEWIQRAIANLSGIRGLNVTPILKPGKYLEVRP